MLKMALRAFHSMKRLNSLPISHLPLPAWYPPLAPGRGAPRRVQTRKSQERKDMGLLRGLGQAVGGLLAGIAGLVGGLFQGLGRLLKRVF